MPPIPKSRAICDFNKDLRPISVTSTLSKVEESFVIEQELKLAVISFIDWYGFIRSSSTTFALISMFHIWLGPSDATLATIRTALSDFRKAFDLVDLHKLITKLGKLGVRSTVVNWIIDFLRQTEKVNKRDLVQLVARAFRVSSGFRSVYEAGTMVFLISLLRQLSACTC